MNAPFSPSQSAVKPDEKNFIIDASPIDALCTDGRYFMHGCIDVSTRRLVITTVSKAHHASNVALMIRKAVGEVS